MTVEAAALWKRREGAPPLVFGHRGVRGPVPENTMPAFELAAEEGADGVELDVRLCATGEPVVLHDADLGRVTLGQDQRAASELPYSALARVDIQGAGPPPRLSAVLAWARARRLRVNVEMKRDVPDRTALVRETARLVGLVPDAPRFVIVSSFDPAMIVGFRAFGTGAPTAFLFESSRAHLRPWAWLRALGVDAANPERVLTSPSAVERAHRAGLMVNVWTVNDEAEARDLARIGVDSIITDRPGPIGAAARTGLRPPGAVLACGECWAVSPPPRPPSRPQPNGSAAR
jgi:glycerophosphoryl diester phosphodiesterase